MRIVIVGGGSPYTPGIMWSIIRNQRLAEYDICLFDIDAQRFDLMNNLASRMLTEAKNSAVRVSTTTNLSTALENARYVITNFRTGGLDALRKDETIPLKYGIVGQETTGPGGTFFALRTIPEILKLCTAMRATCPDAWLINYANPTSFVADAVQREGGVKCVSLCDGGGNKIKSEIAEALNVQEDSLQVRCAGTNHPMNWIVSLKIDQHDGYGRIEELSDVLVRNEKHHQKLSEFCRFCLRRYGLYPSNAEYSLPYFDHDYMLESKKAGDRLYERFSRELAILWPRFTAMASGTAPLHMHDKSLHHIEAGLGDIATKVIAALATNERCEVHVNIPNRGSILNLPQESIVEVPAVVDGNGISPICMGSLPKSVVGLTAAIINWQELTVEASFRGDKDKVIQALLAHPGWPLTYDSAERMCEEMMREHARFLPQFAS